MSDTQTSADGFFEEVERLFPNDPPPWVDFEHPDFPKYFQIVVLDDQGEPKTWWQRLPEHLRSRFP